MVLLRLGLTRSRKRIHQLFPHRRDVKIILVDQNNDRDVPRGRVTTARTVAWHPASVPPEIALAGCPTHSAQSVARPWIILVLLAMLKRIWGWTLLVVLGSDSPLVPCPRPLVVITLAEGPWRRSFCARRPRWLQFAGTIGVRLGANTVETGCAGPGFLGVDVEGQLKGPVQKVAGRTIETRITRMKRFRHDLFPLKDNRYIASLRVGLTTDHP